MDFEKFMLKQTEWRGEVNTTLKTIAKELEELKEEHKDTNGKIDIVNNKLTGVQIKVAGIGGAIALIVAIVVNVVV